jgi:DNA-binding transcriptional regulator YdaS (Cro superfamily)
MKLRDYLHHNRIPKGEFADLVGISGPWLSQLCEGRGWPSREVAARISSATNGEVTANDFVNLEESSQPAQ